MENLQKGSRNLNPNLIWEDSSLMLRRRNKEPLSNLFLKIRNEITGAKANVFSPAELR